MLRLGEQVEQASGLLPLPRLLRLRRLLLLARRWAVCRGSRPLAALGPLEALLIHALELPLLTAVAAVAVVAGPAWTMRLLSG